MRRKTTVEFIKEAKKIHNNKYDYSKVKYINNYSKLLIICLIHGEFEQVSTVHLRGSGCPKCGVENKKPTTSEFIKKATKVHKNKYDYSKVEYVNNYSKVIIICPIHGKFKQIPYSHLNG